MRLRHEVRSKNAGTIKLDFLPVKFGFNLGCARAPPEARVGLRMVFSVGKTRVRAQIFPDGQSWNFANDRDDGFCCDQDHAYVMGIFGKMFLIYCSSPLVSIEPIVWTL